MRLTRSNRQIWLSNLSDAPHAEVSPNRVMIESANLLEAPIAGSKPPISAIRATRLASFNLGISPNSAVWPGKSTVFQSRG